MATIMIFNFWLCVYVGFAFQDDADGSRERERENTDNESTRRNKINEKATMKIKTSPSKHGGSRRRTDDDGVERETGSVS